MAYIIDIFNKFDSWDRAHAVHRFTLNGVEYAIKEVALEWGVPILPEYVDKENDATICHVYESIDEAKNFIQLMKKLN